MQAACLSANPREIGRLHGGPFGVDKKVDSPLVEAPFLSDYFTFAVAKAALSARR